MRRSYARRGVLAAGAALLGELAGCSVRSDESRVIGIFVVNQTAEPITAEVEVSQEGDVLAEQYLELPAERPDADGSHASMYTQASVEAISEGTTVTAEILVDDDRTASVAFTADCAVGDESTGDEVSFRVQDEIIRTHTGRCTTEGLSV